MELIEPTGLYNLLNQRTRYPALSDPNYLLLLDARNKNEYNESHVITAKKAPQGENGKFVVPYDAELECKSHVVIYDGNTNNLKDEGDALKCGKLILEIGTRNPVKVLKGGYEAFSALYPFLRTQKVLFMPREYDDIRTYPIEIIPGFLYLGTLVQGNAAYIQKHLKVKGHVNCCEEKETFFEEIGTHLLHIKVQDTPEADLYSKFKSACTFIDSHRNRSGVVLVFSDLGISRSVTVVMAYLMHAKALSLKDSFNHVLRCCCNVRPNQGFISQLGKWEKDLFSPKVDEAE